MTKRVVVGLSGGVDSSVAALLLKQAGYEVIGLFMHNWQEESGGVCSAEEDYSDVRRVSEALDIPYYAVDFSKEYYQQVFCEFVQEYEKGRTPNPDVLCNKLIKFDIFSKYAKSFGADYIATGHYAGVRCENGVNYLLQAADKNKDQTYFLNQLCSAQLDNVLFPLCDIKDKSMVRQLALQHGLATAKKKDSTGICFIGERNFRKFLSEYIPMRDGEMRTLDGKTVGMHKGVFYYTCGQRHGLGLGGGGSGEPWFVVSKDVANNILYVCQGECEQLYAVSVTVPGFNYISGKPQGERVRVMCRIRHRQPLFGATLDITHEAIFFDEPVRGVAAGQYAVCYIGDVCIGGGVIESKYM